MKLTPYDWIPWQQLLYSPWRMGLLFQGPRGEISNLIGYTQLFIIILLIILLVRKKIASTYKSLIIFWTTATILLSFLITEQSNFIWKMNPLLAETGSHRLFILVVFCIAILAGYLALLYPQKQKLMYILLFITVFSTFLNWGQRDVLPVVTDTTLINNLPLSTAHGEGHFYANSLYRNPNKPWFSQVPKNHLDILDGIGEMKNIKRNSTDHTYIIAAKTKLSVRENTLFFPGWQIYSDNKLIPIGHDAQGIITFNLPKGLHFIEVMYTDPLVYRILKIISAIGMIVLFLLVIFYLSKQSIWRSTRFFRKNK